MGDERRGETFARFIVRQWKRIETVLVVADGKGQVARKLANKGLHCRVVEASPRLAGNEHPRIVYQQGWFTETSEVKEDLVVGMHPDEATAEIILAAIRNDKPWAVVPCCVKGRHAKNVKNNFTAWIDFLSRIGSPCRTANLPISGRNIILYSK